MAEDYDPAVERFIERYFGDEDPPTVAEIAAEVAGTGINARYSRPLRSPDVLEVTTEDGVTTVRSV